MKMLLLSGRNTEASERRAVLLSDAEKDYSA
jgi:hypothetical protein